MWFKEVLDSHDSTMGYEHDEPFKADDTKMWSFKVKSGVKDASLSTGQDIVKDGKGGYTCKHKTELKTKLSDEWDAKLVSSNKEHEVEFEYKPANLNKDGKEVEIELEAKCQPTKNTWSGEAKLKAGGFDLGPVQLWSTLKLSTDQASSHELDFSNNLVHDKQHYLACQVTSDKNMNVTQAFTYAAMVGPKGNYYLRGDMLNAFIGAGTWFKAGNGSNHSMELQYDILGKKAGMFGQPLFLRYGGKMAFGNVKYGWNLFWGQNIAWKDKLTLPINKNLSVSLTSQWEDKQELITKGGSCPIKTGIAVDLKI